jgi:hypothetical protein
MIISVVKVRWNYASYTIIYKDVAVVMKEFVQTVSNKML